MLLEGKVAVVYGAGGSIGGAVSRAFAREGARVYLAGRTPEKLDKVAGEIRSKGGMTSIALVDALDERAVIAFVDTLVEQAGRIDISFNLISVGDVQKPLMEISVDDFLQVTRLKKEPGQDILIFGSGALVQSLRQHDLIGQYNLLVYPLVLGSGKRLFEEGKNAGFRDPRYPPLPTAHS